jgi:hypothetical protein
MTVRKNFEALEIVAALAQMRKYRTRFALWFWEWNG